MHGRIDEFGAAEHRPCADAGRERPVDILDFCIRRSRDGAAVAADEHQGGAQHHLVAVHTCAACPKFATHGDLCQVPHAHRDAAARGDGDLLDLGEARDQAIGPHHATLAVAFDVICAAAVVVRLDRVDDLAEGNAVSDEARRIGFDPVLLDIAPDSIRTRNARHGPHLRTNDPVLYGAEVDQTLQII